MDNINSRENMTVGLATASAMSSEVSSPVTFFDVTEISLLTLKEDSEMDELISFSPNDDLTTFEPNTTASLAPTLLPPERTLSVAYTVSESIVSLLAIFGNALVVYIFCKNRSLRKYRNYYIFALGIADFLVGLLGIPFAILASVGLPRNLYGCLFTVSILIVLCTVSILCLVAVSIDRYWATTNPFAYYRNMTTTTAVSIILFCWVAGAIIGFLPLFGWYNREGWLGFPSEYCFFTDVMDYSYLVFLYFATIVFPALLMIGFYGYIYHVVLIKIRQKGTLAPQHLRRFSEQSRTGSLSCENRSATQVLRIIVSEKRREAKAAKKLGIIVLFFMLCWMPLYTINCIQAFYPNFHVSIEFLNFTIILSHANSALNPFLYAYHLKEFRMAMKNALLALCRKLSCGMIKAGKDNPLGGPMSRSLTIPSLGHTGTTQHPHGNISVKFRQISRPNGPRSTQISSVNNINSMIQTSVVETLNKDNSSLAAARETNGKSLTNLSVSSDSSYRLLEVPLEVKSISFSSLNNGKNSNNFHTNGKKKVTHISPVSHDSHHTRSEEEVVTVHSRERDTVVKRNLVDAHTLHSSPASIEISYHKIVNAKSKSHPLVNGVAENRFNNKAESHEREGGNGQDEGKDATAKSLSPTHTTSVTVINTESQPQLMYSNEQTFPRTSHLHQLKNAENTEMVLEKNLESETCQPQIQSSL